jgi:CHAD domain-containing protein
MKPERIQEILAKDINKIAGAANEIAPHFRTEDIHKFRVGVKKLRAFMHFISSVNGQPDLKLTKNCKRLYEISGTLRDAHLKYETLTGRNLHLNQYYKNLFAIVDRSKGEWEKLYSKQVMSKLGNEITGYSFNEVNPVNLQHFLAQKIKKIKKINSASPNDEHIHQMRKLIKDMVYITEFAERKWSDAHEAINTIPHKQLIKLSELIGNFNDGSILLRELSSFTSMGMHQAERLAMAGYVELTMARHRSLRKELLLQIEKFVGNVEKELE